jgi:4,5-dihydroxyphthalate decarboxylase
MRISLACWDYDRTRGVAEGRIRPDGLTVDYLALPPEETFFRMIRYREFDAAELSLSSYLISLKEAEPPFVALPVFPSRAFRHSGIYVRSGGRIEQAADLRGARVGVAEYQLTANVWIRGILDEHHDVPFESVTYVIGGLEEPRREEKLALDLPASIAIERAPKDRPLSQLLADGEIDAIYSPRAPSTLGAGVERLFPDFEEVEREYFGRTRVFPIMHVLALRSDVHSAHPWIGQSLVKAFTQARDEAFVALEELTALRISLPWGPAQYREAIEVLGPDYWAYGVEPNRHVLETFIRYSSGQGLCSPTQTVDTMFAPETAKSFAI